MISQINFALKQARFNADVRRNTCFSHESKDVSYNTHIICNDQR